MKKQKHLLAILSVLILTLAVATIIPSRITATEETGTNELLESPVPVEAEEGQEVAEPEEQEEVVAPAEETAAPEEEEELNVSLQSAGFNTVVTEDEVTVTIPGPSAATGDQRGMINTVLATPREEEYEGKTLHVILEKGESDGVYAISGILNIYSDTILELGDGVVIKRGPECTTSMIWNPDGHWDKSDETGYLQSKNITITGGKWMSSSGDGTKVYAMAMHFSHATNITIKNTTIEDCAGEHTVIFDSVNTALVQNCWFNSCRPMKANGDGKYCNEVVHIDAANSGGGFSGEGAKNDPSKNITVDGCHFNGCYTAVGSHYHSGDPIQGPNTVKNCEFRKVDETCVTASNSTGWTVKNNTMNDDCGADVFARLNGCRNFTIDGNKGNSEDGILRGLTCFIEDNGSAGAGASNGKIVNHKGAIVSKNVIRCANVSSNITLNGGTYTSTNTNFKSGNADNFILYFEGKGWGANDPRPKATIENCTFTYQTKTTKTDSFWGLAAIKLSKGSFTFKKNTVTNSPGAALYLYKVGGTYEGNTFKNNGHARTGANTDGCALVIEGSNKITVKNNTINASYLSGIILKGASCNNTITGNNFTYPATSSSNWVKGYPIIFSEKSNNNSAYNNTFSGKADMKESGSSGNFATWSGGTKLPVSATAKYSLKNADKIAVKSGGTYIAVEGNNTVKAKKKGSGTIKLIQNGRERASKKIEVYAFSGEYIMVSSINSNYCLDIRGKSTKNNAWMIVWTRNGGKNQKYSFHLQKDGSYAIRCIHSKKWVTVKDNSTKQSANVVQYSWTGKAGQLWKIQVDAKNNITFVNKGSGKAFDVRHGKAQKGKEMIQYTINGGSNQKWNPKKA